MKYLKTLVFILLSFTAYSQDVIYLKNGYELNGLVTEVGINDIKYKVAHDSLSPVYTVPKSTVLMIVYKSGRKDIFQDAPPQNKEGNEAAGNMKDYFNGTHDADVYYTGSGGMAATTFFTNLIGSPIIGLVPAIIGSTTTPRDINLKYPSEALMQNKEYARGYRTEARRLKSRRIWTAYGISAGIVIVVVVYVAI